MQQLLFESCRTVGEVKAKEKVPLYYNQRAWSSSGVDHTIHCVIPKRIWIFHSYMDLNDNGKHLHLQVKERLRHAVIFSFGRSQSCSILYISWINHFTTKNHGSGKTASVWTSWLSIELGTFKEIPLVIHSENMSEIWANKFQVRDVTRLFELMKVGILNQLVFRILKKTCSFERKVNLTDYFSPCILLPLFHTQF